MGRGAGGRQRSSDLAADQAAFAHAADDDATLYGQDCVDGACELPIQSRLERFYRFGSGIEHTLRGSEIACRV